MAAQQSSFCDQIGTATKIFVVPARIGRSVVVIVIVDCFEYGGD